MISFTDNIDDLVSRIQARADRLGDAEDDNLVADVQTIVGEGQLARAGREIDPSFSQWQPNQPQYAARKGFLPVGVLTGEMLSRENMMGTVQAQGPQITIRYAGSPSARLKVEAFQRGGRLMWGLDDHIRAELKERLREKVGHDLHQQ